MDAAASVILISAFVGAQLLAAAEAVYHATVPDVDQRRPSERSQGKPSEGRRRGRRGVPGHDGLPTAMRREESRAPFTNAAQARAVLLRAREMGAQQRLSEHAEAGPHNWFSRPL